MKREFAAIVFSLSFLINQNPLEQTHRKKTAQAGKKRGTAGDMSSPKYFM
jgi:hypothetical protein